MASETTTKARIVHEHGPLGFVLFVAYIGAAVYFVQQSAGFWGFVFALLKAAVWPAFVLYEVMKTLGI